MYFDDYSVATNWLQNSERTLGMKKVQKSDRQKVQVYRLL